MRNGGDGGLPEAVFRPAWKLDDPEIARDAQAFWRAQGVLGPQEAERRVSELCAVAYADGKVVGVATAYLTELETLKSRFAIFRCSVAPERQNLPYRMAVFSRQVLERWSADNPQEDVMGMAAIIPSGQFREAQRNPLWTEGGLNLTLVGHTRSGDQLRVAWFTHARLRMWTGMQ